VSGRVAFVGFAASFPKKAPIFLLARMNKGYSSPVVGTIYETPLIPYSQFSSHDWRDFLTAHRLRPSMNRRGNCHDNAVAESFFQRATKSSGKSRVIQSRTRKNY